MKLNNKDVSPFIRLGCQRQGFGGTHYDIELTLLTITELMKCLGKGNFLSLDMHLEKSVVVRFRM